MSEVTSLSQLANTPAGDYLVHEEPMILLDVMVKADGDTTICDWTVTESMPFMTPELGIPAYAGIEFMAQCVAVHAGVRARLNGFGPPLGFLLGTRHFRAAVPYLEIGKTYRAVCEELIRDGNGMGSYDCSISLDGTEIATARLAVLEKGQGQTLGE